MPAGYAHYSFGKAVLPTLPGDVRQCIQRFRRMFDMGLQGPDFFFHYNRIVKNRILKLGSAYHGQTGKEFFTRACSVADSEAARAYLYGVLCHYCLDSACHPFIHQTEREGKISHVGLESEFDRFLLERDALPYTHSIAKHVKLTRGECMTVARFYPPATGGNVHWATRLMAFDNNFLTGGNREKRERLLKRFSPKLVDYMIPLTPRADCQRMVSELLARYNRCLRQYPVMLESLRAHMETGLELGELFEGKFG